MDDTEYFIALACRCGCRGNSGLLKGNASSENAGSSVRNASRDIAAPVLEAITCGGRRFEERRPTPSSCSSSITEGLDVQLRFPMMLLFKKTTT
jgi:hypothetical protein